MFAPFSEEHGVDIDYPFFEFLLLLVSHLVEQGLMFLQEREEFFADPGVQTEEYLIYYYPLGFTLLKSCFGPSFSFSIDFEVTR